MKTNRRTLSKYGNRTDAYIPGETLRMKWGREWFISTVRYNEATNTTHINLIQRDNAQPASDQAKRIQLLKMESLIKYYTNDGAYTRKELTLSQKAKEDLLYYITEHEKLFKIKCTGIYVAGKWPEPWPRKDSRTYYATWRIECDFSDGSTTIIHINRKATY